MNALTRLAAATLTTGVVLWALTARYGVTPNRQAAKLTDPFPTASHQPHPRLRLPTPDEIELVRQHRPDYLDGQADRVRDGRGGYWPELTLAAFGDERVDLSVLYNDLMQEPFVDRGNDQVLPLAVAYDWLHARWSVEQRSALLDKLVDGCEFVAAKIRSDKLSPYNVFLYNDLLRSMLGCTLAAHGDSPRMAPVASFTHELFADRVLPVWKQAMGENGGWHEGGEYVAIGIGNSLYAAIDTWRRLTGVDLYEESGIRGFVDFLVYRNRPDGLLMRWGDVSFPDRQPLDRVPLAIETGHRAAYSAGGCPEPYVPSVRPWGPLTDPALCDPLSLGELPLDRLFDGIGMVIARSDWTDDATYVTFKAGDNFWSHSHLDQGAFTLYKGGELAIDSGAYVDYGSDHHLNYDYQTIAHNTLTVTDPDDTVPAPGREGRTRPIANDGGQRRVGSGWGVKPAPLDRAEWEKNREYFHTGKIHRHYSDRGLVVAVAELTPAYTNAESGRGTFSNRTRRVETFWRTFIYDRTEDIVAIFDRVVATDPNFVKRSLVHLQNRPERTPYGFWSDVPAQSRAGRGGGDLAVHVLRPRDAIVNLVGGPGAEYLVEGVNYDEKGRLAEQIARRKDLEPGAWRVEIMPPVAAEADDFLMILKPQLAGQTNPTRIEELADKDGAACRLIGASRTVTLRFPNEREGVRIEGTGSAGQFALDLTVVPPR